MKDSTSTSIAIYGTAQTHTYLYVCCISRSLIGYHYMQHSCLNFKTAVERAYNFIVIQITFISNSNQMANHESNEINRWSSTSSSLPYYWTEQAANYYWDAFSNTLGQANVLCFDNTNSGFRSNNTREHWIHCFFTVGPCCSTNCCLYSPFEHRDLCMRFHLIRWTIFCRL